MARKEDKQPQYLPLIVKAKLHTGGRDYEKIKEELKGQGFTCKQMKGMVREGNYFDGIVLYLSKWNWDNHESWHLYNWDDKDDSCHVSYTDPDSKETIESTYTADSTEGTGQTLEVNEKVRSTNEAYELAKKRLREKNTQQFTATAGTDGLFRS